MKPTLEDVRLIYLGCDCPGATGWAEDHPSVDAAVAWASVCCRCRRVIAVDSDGRRAEREETLPSVISGPSST